MPQGSSTNVKLNGLLVALIVVLTTHLFVCSAASASRGGAPGQDPLLAPGGYDTKASSADDVKQECNQKCGGGGGGGGQGAGGSQFKEYFANASFTGQGMAMSAREAAATDPTYAM